MAKIDLELVKVVLQRSELDAKKIAQIIEDITFESKAQEAEKEKEQLLADAQHQADAILAEGKAAAEAERQHRRRLHRLGRANSGRRKPGHSPRTHTFGLVRLQPDPQRQAHAAKNDCRSMRIRFGENF